MVHHPHTAQHITSHHITRHITSQHSTAQHHRYDPNTYYSIAPSSTSSHLSSIVLVQQFVQTGWSISSINAVYINAVHITSYTNRTGESTRAANNEHEQRCICSNQSLFSFEKCVCVHKQNKLDPSERMKRMCPLSQCTHHNNSNMFTKYTTNR